MVKNLNQLKRFLREGVRFEIIDHCHPECIGQIREITKINTQGFYSKVIGRSDAKVDKGNRGREPMTWWGYAGTWEFETDVCKSYTRTNNHTPDTLIMAFRLLDEEAV